MKKLRSLFVAVIVIAAGSTPSLMPAVARADSTTSKSHNQRGSMQKQMEMMAQYLELTDAQKKKIKPIMDQAQQRSVKVREDKSLSPEQKRAKMKAIREDSWKKINPILTDAQRKKIAAMRPAAPSKSGQQNQAIRICFHKANSLIERKSSIR